MNINCTNCNESFVLSAEQERFIYASKEKGMTFLMLECALCGTTFDYNPQDEDEEEGLLWHSPISGSNGFVSYIDQDESFYGCGETGAVWFDKKNFYKEIESILQRYGHRKEFYKKVGNDWLPQKIDLKRARKLIEKEEKAIIENYER